MKKKEQTAVGKAVQMRDGSIHPFGAIRAAGACGGREAELYRSMREAVPILDAAVEKLVRLTDGFTVNCQNKAAEVGLRKFLRTVPTGYGQCGISSFLTAYLDSLLTYGCAIGEMVVSGGELAAVLWGDAAKIHIQEGETPLDFAIGMYDGGRLRILPYQNLLLFTTREPDAAHPYGTSLFRSMPFLVDILLKIYQTIGTNWERAGNVRYSVVYKPSSETDRGSAKERSEQMAEQWAKAMTDSRDGSVRDFVAVGDVQIKVIGADGQILDSEVPVRQIMEQLVAKTGLPPFLLGLSWSSTERMSAQQTDLLTSELWAIRRTVQPVLEKICTLWLHLHGYGEDAEIVWDEISLADIVDQAHAEYYRAQAEKLGREE